MTTTTLTTVSANIKNSRQAVRYLRDRSRRDARGHYDIASVYEASKRRRQLRQLPGHDYRTADVPGIAQDVGLLVGRHLGDHGGGSEFLSPDTGDRWSKIGKERWGLSRVIVVDGGELAVIALHPVPGPNALDGDDPDHPLVARYRMAMRWMTQRLAYHQALGHPCIVMSDIQTRAGNTRPWSPRHVFQAHRMTWAWHGIDVVAATRELSIISEQAVPGAMPDHPLLRVRLGL